MTQPPRLLGDRPRRANHIKPGARREPPSAVIHPNEPPTPRRVPLAALKHHDWTWDHDHDIDGQRRLQDKSRLGDVFQTPLGPLDEHGFARDYFNELNQRHAGLEAA